MTVTEKFTLPPTFLNQLGRLYSPQNLFTDPTDCWAYGYDNSQQHALPDAVAFPSTHDQVLATVKLCNSQQVPLIARGRGTGTTGATVPCTGGLVVSFERMNRVLDFSPENRYVIVEPGMTNQTLQDQVGEANLFWPPDPTSAAYCTIGGNLAYNSAGPRAVKYGTPRENTLGIRIVTGAGDSMRVGVCTSKGVVGYDLTRLILGSEGTLAVITEATLKLTPLAEAKRTLRVTYESVVDAANAITRIMAQPVAPCALEFMDGSAIEMIRRYSNAELPEDAGALLMIEVDGPAKALDLTLDSVTAAARCKGLLELRIAKTSDEISALWQTRKALSPALRKVAPMKINEDIVVPVTEISTLIDGLQGLSKRYQLPIVNFGHAGNGNIHVNILLDPKQPGAQQRADACLDEVFTLALKLKGTLSGEHGVGLVKRDYIDREIDESALRLMRAIKSQFDPNNILNPNKLLPAPP